MLGTSATEYTDTDTADDVQKSSQFNVVVVATTVFAALALACTGSAFVWRSKQVLGSSASTTTVAGGNAGASLSSSSSSSSAGSMLSHSQMPGEGSSGSSSGAKDSKQGNSARSKERRRRGKDPFKELLKAEKKGKPTLGTARGGWPSTTTLDSSSEMAMMMRPSTPSTTTSTDQTSRHSSASRSVSTASSTRTTETAPVAPVSLPPPPTVTTSSGETVHGFPSSASSSRARAPESDAAFSHNEGSSSSSASSSSLLHYATSMSSMTSAGASSLDSDPHPTVPPSSSFPSSSSSTNSLFASPIPITYLSSSPPPPPVPFSESRSRLSGPRGNVNNNTSSGGGGGQWDRDGNALTYHTTTADSTMVYRKPPRFRSKSRNSPPPATPYPTPASPPLPDGIPAFTVSPSNPLSPRHANALASGSSSSSSTPRENVNMVGGTTSTVPLGQGSDSSLAQMAALRRALDLARVREDKARKDAERYQKELEMIQWEGMHWRRREAEMQSQMQLMLHQIQALSLAAGHGFSPFAAPVMQPPPTDSPRSSPQTASSSAGQTPSQSGPGTPQIHSPPPPPPPPAHIAAALQLFPPPSTTIHPHSPYFPHTLHAHSNPQSPSTAFYYPPANSSSPLSPSSSSSPSTTSSPHLLSPRSTQGQQQQQQIFSMLFPHYVMPSPTTVPSSPEVLGMSSGMGMGMSRGRKKMRGKLPNGSAVGSSGAGAGVPPRHVDVPGVEDGWMVDPHTAVGGEYHTDSVDGMYLDERILEEEDQDQVPREAAAAAAAEEDIDEEEEDEEEELSELLVGAILKRPETMRSMSSRSKSARNGSPAGSCSMVRSLSRRGVSIAGTGTEGGAFGSGDDVVFTFPSISNSYHSPSPHVPVSVSVPRMDSTYSPPPPPLDVDEEQPVEDTGSRNSVPPPSPRIDED